MLVLAHSDGYYHAYMELRDAEGFVTEDEPLDSLVEGIRVVAHGQSGYVGTRLARRLREVSAAP